jgi:hypothetical protein
MVTGGKGVLNATRYIHLRVPSRTSFQRGRPVVDIAADSAYKRRFRVPISETARK